MARAEVIKCFGKPFFRNSEGVDESAEDVDGTTEGDRKEFIVLIHEALLRSWRIEDVKVWKSCT